MVDSHMCNNICIATIWFLLMSIIITIRFRIILQMLIVVIFKRRRLTEEVDHNNGSQSIVSGSFKTDETVY